jgi:phosphoribosylformimino-5-aminoimidazole carboxamide ribotide isomerase
MQIWPAIDLRGGKCVRLQQGDYRRETIFGDDPVEIALRWRDAGADRLHLVDLDGARDGSPANREAVEAIVQAVQVPCQLGGGIREQANIEAWLERGIERLVVGTRALKDPPWLREMCHRYPGHLVLGLDAKNGRVATDGWLEVSDIAAVEFVQQFAAEPLAAIVYTDIARDGMLAGPNFGAVAQMRDHSPLPLIASGGVTTLDDVRQLAQLRIAGCIVGRALYEGRLTLEAVLEVSREQRAESRAETGELRAEGKIKQSICPCGPLCPCSPLHT